MIHHVQSAHRQTCTVGDNAHCAVQADVLESLFASKLFTSIKFFGCTELFPFRMTEVCVAIERDLGIECMYFACGLQNQWVDFSQVAVTFGVAAIELDQNVSNTIESLCGNLCVYCCFVCGLARQSIHRIDVQLHDCIGIALGDHFNFDATFSAQHQQVLLCSAIKRERCVVLLGDIACVFYPYALDDMALDVHAQDVSSVQTYLIGILCQLDSACLATTAHLHLCFHYNGVSRFVSSRDCLINSDSHIACRNRNVVASKILLALVFKKVHR
ncbi:unannotated protein [freshwater metagenome]|uniref:Unannotated protein n=1 Tax=freshwater metagenome TaxID=449393 RepID=A0A6J6ED18_9ZZZZ